MVSDQIRHKLSWTLSWNKLVSWEDFGENSFKIPEIRTCIWC